VPDTGSRRLLEARSMAEVIIGVDPHKLSATIEIVDRQERLVATGRFAPTSAGTPRCGPTSAPFRTGCGRWRAPTAPAGRWPSGWSRTANGSLTSPRSWPRGRHGMNDHLFAAAKDRYHGLQKPRLSVEAEPKLAVRPLLVLERLDPHR